MAYPVLHVYLGSLFDPDTESVFDEPDTWTDITADVKEVGWQRGRQKDLDEIAVGTGTLLLRQKNNRNYDPTNEAGPYFPLAARPIKVEAVHSSTTYPLFRGWAANWHVVWNPDWEPEQGQGYSEVQVDLVDAIALFQAYDGTAGTDGQTIAVRIGAVLDALDFPAGMRSLSGGSTVLASSSGRAWEHIQDCVRSDISMNVCYVNGAGYVIFGNPVSSGVTFGDGGGTELPYSGTGIDYGVDLVYNSVTVTREGGTPQQVVERGGFGRRAYDRATLNTSDADALLLAQALADQYQVPKARPEPMRIRPGNRDSVWTQVLDLDLEHKFEFIKRPPGGGDNFEQEMKIVGLETKANPAYADWTTTYRLVGRSMMFPASANITDTFSAAGGPPPSGWTALFDSGLVATGGQCAPNDSGANDGYRTTGMTSADVDVFVTMVVLPPASTFATGTRLFARLNVAGAGSDWYSVMHYVTTGTDEIYLERCDSGALTTIAGPYQWNPTGGEGLGIRCRGDRIEAWVRIAGVWTRVLAVTDATYDGTGAGNKVGLGTYGNGISTVARYDDFGANAN